MTPPDGPSYHSSSLGRLALVGLLFVVLPGLFLLGWSARQWLAPEPDVVASAQTAILKLEGQRKLITLKAVVQTVVRQSDEQWFGKAEVIRIVPARVSYGVDLAKLNARSLRYDPAARRLTIALPPVEVLAIDPDLANAQVIRTSDLLRRQGGVVNQLEDATLTRLRPALEAAAKDPALLDSAREQTKIALRALLEPALAAAGGGVAVTPVFAGRTGPGS
jgi:hypothetical protein